MAQRKDQHRSGERAAGSPAGAGEPGSGSLPRKHSHPGADPHQDSAGETQAGTPAPSTDGHWPFARPAPAAGPGTLICCECGEAPSRRPARMSMLHAWHQAHRRKLRLQPVEYAWPDSMAGLSTGGYVQVPGALWRDGRWIPE